MFTQVNSNKTMDAIDFLISRNILKDRDLDKRFPLNLSRDTNIASAKAIVKAMEDYRNYKSENIIGENANSFVKE